MYYKVGVKEVHTAYYYIAAGSPERAVEMINERKPDSYIRSSIEYSHTLPHNTWSADEVKDKR